MSIIVPLADAIKEIAEGEGVGAKGYRWAPRELDSVPAVVVELPGFERTGVDEPEDHLGQKDWRLTFPAVFYFDLSEATASQDEAVTVVENFVTAIDNDPTLGGLCQEAKAVEAGIPEFPEDDTRALIRWPVRVDVLKFV